MASDAASLVDQGHLVRLWKPPAAPGETKALGLYRAESEADFAGLLGALPFYDWMQVTVTPLGAPVPTIWHLGRPSPQELGASNEQ